MIHDSRRRCPDFSAFLLAVDIDAADIVFDDGSHVIPLIRSGMGCGANPWVLKIRKVALPPKKSGGVVTREPDLIVVILFDQGAQMVPIRRKRVRLNPAGYCEVAFDLEIRTVRNFDTVIHSVE